MCPYSAARGRGVNKRLSSLTPRVSSPVRLHDETLRSQMKAFSERDEFDDDQEGAGNDDYYEDIRRGNDFIDRYYVHIFIIAYTVFILDIDTQRENYSRGARRERASTGTGGRHQISSDDAEAFRYDAPNDPIRQSGEDRPIESHATGDSRADVPSQNAVKITQDSPSHTERTLVPDRQSPSVVSGNNHRDEGQSIGNKQTSVNMAKSSPLPDSADPTTGFKRATIQFIAITAMDLPNVERDGGKNDVFVDLTYGKLWKTRTEIRNGSGESAHWDISQHKAFRYDVTLQDLKECDLEVTVNDSNVEQSDILIGKASCNLHNALVGTVGAYEGKNKCQLLLDLTNEKDQNRGQVEIMFQLDSVIASLSGTSSNTGVGNRSEDDGPAAKAAVKTPSSSRDTNDTASTPADGAIKSAEAVNKPADGAVKSAEAVSKSDHEADDDGGGLYFDENDRIAGGKCVCVLLSCHRHIYYLPVIIRLNVWSHVWNNICNLN